MSFIAGPIWTDDQLEADREKAVAIFRKERLTESLEDYIELFEEAQASTEDLIETTVDLTDFSEALNIISDEALRYSFRYLAGPPISDDNLKDLADSRTFSKSKLENLPEEVSRYIETVLIALDKRRFAWISENRVPTDDERKAAVLATATAMAAAKMLTKRRTEDSQQQEAELVAMLKAAGLKQLPARSISTWSDVPEKGSFCGESEIQGRKADVVLRLWDNRMMAIECKVSNDATNSIKRILNDAAVKAGYWKTKFGEDQVVPILLFSGVAKLSHLKKVQDRGMHIFWSHSLERMIDWIEQTRS